MTVVVVTPDAVVDSAEPAGSVHADSINVAAAVRVTIRLM